MELIGNKTNVIKELLNLRSRIQEIFGHKSGKATVIYTNFSTKHICKKNNTLDALNLNIGG